MRLKIPPPPCAQVRIGAKAADNDVSRQLKLAREFLDKGQKVRLVVVYPRRDAESGRAMLAGLQERVAEWAQVQTPLKSDRSMVRESFALILSPSATGSRL